MELTRKICSRPTGSASAHGETKIDNAKQFHQILLLVSGFYRFGEMCFCGFNNYWRFFTGGLFGWTVKHGKIRGLFLSEKKGKTTNSVRQKLDARAEDFRGRISQNKRPSFDWIFSKLKYNKNTWPVHSTSEYCSDSGAIKGNYLPMFNLRIDLFNSVFFGENHWIFNKCALAVNLGDVNIPLFH